MKSTVVLLVVFSCSIVFAQTIQVGRFPDAPSTAINADSPKLVSESTAPPLPDGYLGTHGQPVIKVVTPNSKPQPKVADRKFLFLFAIAAATTVADLELTSRCLRAQTCSEINPIYGRNPSRARMYSISLPLLGGQTALSAWLKHRHPYRKTWMIPMIGGTAAHSIGAATTIGK